MTFEMRNCPVCDTLVAVGEDGYVYDHIRYNAKGGPRADQDNTMVKCSASLTNVKQLRDGASRHDVR